MRRAFLALFTLLFLAWTAPSVAAGRPIAVLVSIDGFRADYLDRRITPVLSGLAAEGARAAMRPSFPSKTFPNHYALITGLRPDRNGIVENIIEDPALPGITFKMSNHYGRNPRVAPFFCLPETGWTLTTRGYKPSHRELGNHGFDPYSPEMAAMFVASGPAFRRGIALPAFDNVSVYPLLARLVGVKPAPNDGDLRDVEAALAP